MHGWMEGRRKTKGVGLLERGEERQKEVSGWMCDGEGRGEAYFGNCTIHTSICICLPFQPKTLATVICIVA